MRNWLLAISVSGLLTGWIHGAELLELAPANWDDAAPAGKEVDAIYGDYVLRNDRLTVVIGRPGPNRDANMSIRRVGGSIIDFSPRPESNDQLTAYFPLGGWFDFSGPAEWPNADEPAPTGSASLVLRGVQRKSEGAEGTPALTAFVRYNLLDGENYLTIESIVKNNSSAEAKAPLEDTVWAEGFDFGFDSELALWWTHDLYWRQAYGVQGVGGWEALREPRGSIGHVRYARAGTDPEKPLNLAAGESLKIERRLYAAADGLALRAAARQAMGHSLGSATLVVSDPQGPLPGATVRVVTSEGKTSGLGLTSAQGELKVELPPGKYTFKVEADGREPAETAAEVAATPAQIPLQLPAIGKIVIEATDDAGVAIACKAAFHGQEGTPDPNFGPDTAIYGVRNLQYSPDGKIAAPVRPGKYQLIISHGPEYDAVIENVEATAGQTTLVRAKLRRSVNTTGWLSAELHSHSSPSGDNNTSQRGRVLNLLAEHLEFAPCTEHQRVCVYDEDLEFFGATEQMVTCAGMELTGGPLPINHQNAFPLVEHRHRQDGGGPHIHRNPLVQIERLAMWDNGSDKLVQTNHPNIAQMVGDKDLNGQPDGGFEKMFAFMDVIEIHPPEMIFIPLEVGSGGWDDRGTPIHNWLQLLNLGYRIPGVVNTDAHYNFHGSGWLRNYVKSSTDDPGKASVMELVHETEQGHVVMSNGPFMEVTATAGQGEPALPGDDLKAPEKKVNLKIRVECPNWLEVNRVQIFANGRPLKEHNYTRRSHADKFGTGPVIFNQELSLVLDADAHLVVAAAGEGHNLGQVYGEESGKAMPVAVSNPIFVDVDSDGFEHNGDNLGIPLPVKSDIVPSHGHHH